MTPVMMRCPACAAAGRRSFLHVVTGRLAICPHRLCGALINHETLCASSDHDDLTLRTAALCAVPGRTRAGDAALAYLDRRGTRP